MRGPEHGGVLKCGMTERYSAKCQAFGFNALVKRLWASRCVTLVCIPHSSVERPTVDCWQSTHGLPTFGEVSAKNFDLSFARLRHAISSAFLAEGKEESSCLDGTAATRWWTLQVLEVNILDTRDFYD